MTTEISATQGVLLAGGLARRMGGGDKPMRTIGGRTILERVIARLKPQCDGLILNANGDPARFAAFGLQVIADDVPGFPGPLAGILAALDWTAANRPEAEWVLSAAGDCPKIRSPDSWRRATTSSGASCSDCQRWASHPFTYSPITSGSLLIHLLNTVALTHRAARPRRACRGQT